MGEIVWLDTMDFTDWSLTCEADDRRGDATRARARSARRVRRIAGFDQRNSCTEYSFT